jgi:predicted metal-binding protein
MDLNRFSFVHATTEQQDACPRDSFAFLRPSMCRRCKFCNVEQSEMAEIANLDAMTLIGLRALIRRLGPS